MISYMIPLVASFLVPAFMRFWWYPLLALSFLAIFPAILKRFTTWR